MVQRGENIQMDLENPDKVFRDTKEPPPDNGHSTQKPSSSSLAGHSASSSRCTQALSYTHHAGLGVTGCPWPIACSGSDHAAAPKHSFPNYHIQTSSCFLEQPTSQIRSVHLSFSPAPNRWVTQLSMSDCKLPGERSVHSSVPKSLRHS